MAGMFVVGQDSFLSRIERVRREIATRFTRARQLLQEREAVLLSELKELENIYKGMGLPEQIDELNRMKELQLANVKRNENEEILKQTAALLDARMEMLRENFMKGRVSNKNVVLQWDEELEMRISQMGVIKVNPNPDYKKKGLPVKVSCTHSGDKSTAVGVFCSPKTIATDPQGDMVFICDGENNRVQVFTQSFDFLFEFSELMKYPFGICILQDKIIYVTQWLGSSLNEYTDEGKLLRSIGRYGNGQLEFAFPTGVAASAEKKMIYVCDSGNNRIQCLNLDLTFNSYISDIDGPLDIKLTSNEILVVLSSADPCIRYYDHSHHLIEKIIPRKVSKVESPNHFCLDQQNNILMTDTSTNCMSIFSSSGELLYRFGREGKDIGEFIQPTGIALDSENRIIVASLNSKHCIQLF